MRYAEYFIESDDGRIIETNDVKLWSATPRKHVGDDTVGGYRVSTVFLGTDHGFGAPGGPVLYETMLFGEGPHDQYCDRYHKRDEAAAAHARICAALADGSFRGYQAEVSE